MAGVTPNGIRYPDGASKAKNLGPELQVMAEDIDTFIDVQLDPNGPLKGVIEGVAEDVVPGVVADVIEGTGILPGGRISDTGVGVSSTATLKDLNALPDATGWYRASESALNRPPSDSAFNVFHMVYGPTSGAQIAITVSGTAKPRTYVRVKRAGAWEAWAKLVQFKDPGIPEEGQWPHDPALIARETDLLGRPTRSVLTDGTQHMPKARVDQLEIGRHGVSMRSSAPGSGVGITFRTRAGHMTDLTVGEDGHFLPHTLDFIADYVRGEGPAIGGYDLAVCGGQSNAAEAGYLELPNFREEDTRQLFAWEGGQIVPLSASKVYLGAEFIRAYARHAARTGRRVLIVPAGVGSLGFTTTSIQPPPAGYRYFANGTWDRTLTADTKNRFSMMVAATLAALSAAGPGSRVVALLWSQGEADGGLTQAEYAAKLDDLITAFRVAMGDANLPAIIGSMTPEMHSDHEGFEHIARALADTPRRLERVGFVWGPANGHRYFQTVHYSAAGQIDRAGRMAREGLTEALANVATSEPVAPLNARITRSGGKATAEWDRPLCHVDSLAVEFSTNYNPAQPELATWTAATIDTMHGSRATAAVPTGTAVTFRIVATNAVGSSMPAIVNG